VLSPFGLFLLADRESVGHPTGVVESQGVVQMVFEDGDVSEKRLLPLGEAFGCFLFDSGESIFAGFQQYSSTLYSALLVYMMSQSPIYNFQSPLNISTPFLLGDIAEGMASLFFISARNEKRYSYLLQRLSLMC